jgi:predicted RNase H-like nuclease (RuvC/YqgF family)
MYEHLLDWLLANLPGSIALVISFGLAIAYIISQLRRARAEVTTAAGNYLTTLGNSASTIVTSATLQVDLLVSRVTALEAQVRRMEEVVMLLQGENAQLLEENRDLRERLQDVTAVNLGFQVKIEQLKRRIRSLEQNNQPNGITTNVLEPD